MQTKRAFHKESGNAAIAALVVLVVIAVGVLVYMSGKTKTDETPAQTAAAQQTADEDQLVIKPGNPVVAKVGDTEITRMDVFNFIQTLPPNARQTPVNQLFPAALEQVINAKVIEKKTSKVNLDGDPEVKRQMELAKENIVRNVYVQNQVNARLTEERIKSAYEQYKANFPVVEEIKARHILVKEESKARALLKDLQGGADFAQLAAENSIDGTKDTGGDLGYFAKADVVPAFADAAFALEPGSMTTKPVKTDFGYHIIKLEDKRQRPPASFEEIKPFLEAQLRQLILAEVIRDWRSASTIKRFDINGEQIEPAAGGN